LLEQLASALNRTPRDIVEEVSDPGDELQFKSIDIQFFVIKSSFQAPEITSI
jgi:hypothetical protein